MKIREQTGPMEGFPAPTRLQTTEHETEQCYGRRGAPFSSPVITNALIQPLSRHTQARDTKPSS